MDTNKTISTENVLSLKVLSFPSQTPDHEKIKVSTRKMEMLPEKIDCARIWGGLQPPLPPSPIGSYAYESKLSGMIGKVWEVPMCEEKFSNVSSEGPSSERKRKAFARNVRKLLFTHRHYSDLSDHSTKISTVPTQHSILFHGIKGSDMKSQRFDVILTPFSSADAIKI